MVRSFSSRQVDDSILSTILSNMNKSPSAGFSQGIEFVVLRSDDRRQIFFRQWGSEEDRKSYRESWPHLEQAPIIILVCSDESRYQERYGELDKKGLSEIPWWFVDAGMSTLLGLLSTVDAGLVATFTGVKNQDYLRHHLHIPVQVHIVGALLIGYQEGDYRPSSSVARGRRPTEEIVHYDGW